MAIEQQYFTELVIEDQHRELLEKLSEILNAIPTPDNRDVVSAINRNSELAKGFADAIMALPKPQVRVDAPQITVEQTQLDVSQLVATLNQNAEKIVLSNDKILNQLKELNRLKEWTLDFRRTSEGFITSPIIAKQIK